MDTMKYLRIELYTLYMFTVLFCIYEIVNNYIINGLTCSIVVDSSER